MNKTNVHLRVTRSTRKSPLPLLSFVIFSPLTSSSLAAILFLPPPLNEPPPPETFLVDLSVPPPWQGSNVPSLATPPSPPPPAPPTATSTERRCPSSLGPGRREDGQAQHAAAPHRPARTPVHRRRPAEVHGRRRWAARLVRGFPLGLKCISSWPFIIPVAYCSGILAAFRV